MVSVEDITKRIASISNEFENNNSELKKNYLLKNIMAAKKILNLSNYTVGTFGTGYPYYALNYNLDGELPIIDEQIRYNNQLINDGKNSTNTVWTCAACLNQNYDNMPDLKIVCKPCPNMDSTLKPRKLINRLPDIDMWCICEDGQLENIKKDISMNLQLFNMKTSDVNPMKTFNSIERINRDLNKGKMPNEYLPIDVHIVEKTKLKNLIESIPSVLHNSNQLGQIPFIPITPLSLRKQWQYDDEAYNFVFDFLYSFTLLNGDKNIQKSILEARKKITNEFSDVKIEQFILQCAKEPVLNRIRTGGLSSILKERIHSWRGENKHNNITHDDK